MLSSGLLLPITFDPVRLRAALAEIGPGEWSPHYNTGDYGGVWRGVALRSPDGSSSNLDVQPPMPGASFSDTPLLERCPYLRHVLAAFHCPLKSVRLLALAPDSFIREHCDAGLEFENGEARLHIPVQTGPHVEFYVAGERLLLSEGFCYYVNVNLPHRVNNPGPEERIHLVLDVAVNDWLGELFARARAAGSVIPRCPAPPRGFAEFREFAVQSPEVREELRAIAGRDALIARTVHLGRELGYQFTNADVGSSLESVPAAVPEGWTPTRVRMQGEDAMAEWIYTGSFRFTEPFFHDSIRMAKRNPFAALFRREMPLDAADGLTPLAPTGFLFHMSRCGSTLIAQMLASLDRTVVIAEAAPIDDVLQAQLSDPGLPRDRQIRRLRQTVAALGQRRTGEESLYFVKFDSWHIHRLELIREAFPAVPWIFVHRRLEEVVASQLRQPGLQGLPGAMDPRALGLGLDDITRLTRAQWRRRVIAGFLDAAEAFRHDPAGLFIDYRDLPEAVWGPIAGHFGVRFTAAEVAGLQERALWDAKNPGHLFSPALTAQVIS